MIERISVALAVAIHLGIILLLGRLNFEVQESEQEVSAMDIKFRGVQNGPEIPQIASAPSPEASPDLDARAAPRDETADTEETLAAPPSRADAMPEPAPPLASAPEAPPIVKPASTPKPEPETLAIADPAPEPISVPRPASAPAPPSRQASAPAAQPVPMAPQAPSPADSRRAVSALAASLPQSRERPRPRLNATVLSGLRDAAGSENARSKFNSAAIGSAISVAAPRGLPGLTTRQKIDLAQKVREQVMPCWKPPASDAPIEATVRLRFRLDRKGGVVGLPAQSGVTDPALPNAAYLSLLANSGRRAILMCAPLKLPPDLYEAWAEVEVEFDPRDVR